MIFFFFAVPPGILVLQPGIEPWPPERGPEALTTGLPRKSIFFKFLSHQIKAFLNLPYLNYLINIVL